MNASVTQSHPVRNEEFDASGMDEPYPLDESLVIADEVAAALAVDPRMARSVIEVVYDCGIITLTGNVEDELAHKAAEEVAHCHERVVSVVNALEVRPAPDLVAMAASKFGEIMIHLYDIRGRPQRIPRKI